MIPEYKEPVNSPFVPEEQKIIQQKVETEAPRIPYTDKKPTYVPQAPKPLVDLQVYQPAPAKPQSNLVPKTINPAQYFPMSLPFAGPYFPPQFNPYWPMYQPQMVSPIIKQYSINNAPFLETVNLKTGGIREDVLPKQLTNTSNTLGERLGIHSFVRSVFIKTYDGEDIDISGGSSTSILRYLKFLELNPYCSENNDNPYSGMSTDMLLYKSCYPIKYDENSNSLQCSPNSLGLNIRIYSLTFAEYNVKKINNSEFSEYDIWREIAYYEFIRENILKKKLCPNFVLLHAYYISENCNIDRNKVLLLKGKSSKKYSPYILFLTKQLNVLIQQIKRMYDYHMKYIPPFIDLKALQYFEQEIYALQRRHTELRNLELAIMEQQQIQKTQQLFNDINTELKKLKDSFVTKPPPVMPSTITTTQSTTIISGPKMATAPDIHSLISPTLYSYSNKGLVALTEAPHYNLTDWCSIKYETHGNINKMINTGYHSSSVWISVLFQIMAALYVLQLKGIAFANFSISDNIYIRDITLHNNVKTYWKYMIGGYEFYVPNYGYLVLIDSNYKDIIGDCSTLISLSDTPTHKIISNIFKAGEHDDETIKDLCFSAFINTFDMNNFSKSFSNFGGSAIPEDIKMLLGNISNGIIRTNIKDIKYYIRMFMGSLLNNRVGTLLNETELKFINQTDGSGFKEGQIIVLVVASDTFKFVIYVESDSATGKHRNLTKNENNEFIIEGKHKSELFNYSKTEGVVQIFKSNEINFSEDNLLETYTCQ